MSGLTKEQQKDLEKRVPPAVFIENVEEACRIEGVEGLLALLDQQYNKYRLVEGQLVRSSQSMTSKIPEIEKTIQMVEALRSNSDMDVDFMVSDGIFVRGKAKTGLERVSLWLGANTIVELTFDEALALLTTNLTNARESLSQITEELTYLKDQKTTTEVNVARVYNHSIALKREAQIAKTS